jgi:hypothetical protein
LETSFIQLNHELQLVAQGVVVVEVLLLFVLLLLLLLFTQSSQLATHFKFNTISSINLIVFCHQAFWLSGTHVICQSAVICKGTPLALTNCCNKLRNSLLAK